MTLISQVEDNMGDRLFLSVRRVCYNTLNLFSCGRVLGCSLVFVDGGRSVEVGASGTFW